MTKHLEAIMQKEMTRKEFLATLGFGLAAVFGLSSLLKLLTGKSNPWATATTHAYGSGPYGGRKLS